MRIPDPGKVTILTPIERIEGAAGCRIPSGLRLILILSFVNTLCVKHKKDLFSLLFRQDLVFTANYGFYKLREKTYRMLVKIHLRNELVRIAIFVWIFTCYWNGGNSNSETEGGRNLM